MAYPCFGYQHSEDEPRIKDPAFSFSDFMEKRGMYWYPYKVITFRVDREHYGKSLRQHINEYEKEASERLQERQRIAREQQRIARMEQMRFGYKNVEDRPLDKLPAMMPFKGDNGDYNSYNVVDSQFLEKLLPGCGVGGIGVSETKNTELYDPLPDRSWFRLLIVEPGIFGSELKCHLKAVRLEDAAGRYHALSYCWAQPVTFSPVSVPICNGTKIDVSLNLRLALMHLRHRVRHRIIWADAICINQRDCRERNQQVEVMGSIYSQASKTMLWLGDAPKDEILLALETICKIVNRWDDTQPAFYWKKNSPKKRFRRYKPTGNSTLHLYELYRVEHLFRLPWFERRWVIQEAILSRSPVVVLPNVMISWSWIGLAAAIIRNQYDSIMSIPNIYNAYLMIRLSAHGSLPPLQLTFLQLLRLTTEFKATERSDVVFGLLGIVCKDSNPDTAPFIPVDYTLSEDDLGRVIAEKLMMQPDPLGFLSDAASESRKVGESAVSWIPRWTKKRISMLDPWSLDKDRSSFCPAKGLPFKRYTPQNPLHLVVDGIEVSMIAWRSSTFGRGEAFDSTIKAILTMAQHRASGLSSIETMTVFSRILCGGRDAYDSPNEDRAAYVPDFVCFLHEWQSCHGDLSPQLGSDLSKLTRRGDFTKFMRVAGRVCSNRCVFVTTGGHVGLVPAEIVTSDVVCVLGGAIMPFVLRRRYGYFTLVGDCFIDNMMEGEAVVAMQKREAHKGPILTDDFLRDMVGGYRLSREEKENTDKKMEQALSLCRKRYATCTVSCIEIH